LHRPGIQHTDLSGCRRREQGIGIVTILPMII